MLKKVFQLAVYVGVIWAFLWIATPVIVSHIPALEKYGNVAAENDIQPGALYYTDVPVTPDAELNNRDTVRFLPRAK